jgi:hypothetical protein
MNSLAAIVTVVALAMPAAGGRVALAPASSVAHEAAPLPAIPKLGSAPPASDAFRRFRESYRPQEQDQVRIEQRMIIRISPSPPAVRREVLGPPQRADDGPMRYKEKKFHDCVKIENIAGITPMRPNRLVLFMRDHRVLSAALERACDADAFYLGAYVERSSDGKLCKGRDALRARTGATCRIARFSRLVAVKD